MVGTIGQNMVGKMAIYSRNHWACMVGCALGKKRTYYCKEVSRLVPNFSITSTLSNLLKTKIARMMCVMENLRN